MTFSGVAQMFSCGQLEYIAHASVMSMVAAHISYQKNNEIYVWIAKVRLVYVGLTQACLCYSML